MKLVLLRFRKQFLEIGRSSWIQACQSWGRRRDQWRRRVGIEMCKFQPCFCVSSVRWDTLCPILWRLSPDEWLRSSFAGADWWSSYFGFKRRPQWFTKHYRLRAYSGLPLFQIYGFQISKWRFPQSFPSQSSTHVLFYSCSRAKYEAQEILNSTTKAPLTRSCVGIWSLCHF